MKPRVFIGTMHCGEGGFSCHKASINEQKGVQVTHVVVSDLPEKEAHNALWGAWREAKAEHDMFIKVDADTELAHDEVALEFWQFMQSNTRITGIQAPLLDYFTDGYINGLNCFSPRVTFLDSSDELFCDRRVDVDHDLVIKADNVPQRLRPAGYHCYHASPMQAFHFGVHRALKGQRQVLDLMKKAWDRHQDDLRAWALVGASTSPTFTDGGFNYSDERFKQAFDGLAKRFDQLKKTL